MSRYWKTVIETYARKSWISELTIEIIASAEEEVGALTRLRFNEGASITIKRLPSVPRQGIVNMGYPLFLNNIDDSLYQDLEDDALFAFYAEEEAAEDGGLSVACDVLYLTLNVENRFYLLLDGNEYHSEGIGVSPYALRHKVPRSRLTRTYSLLLKSG